MYTCFVSLIVIAMLSWISLVMYEVTKRELKERNVQSELRKEESSQRIMHVRQQVNHIDPDLISGVGYRNVEWRIENKWYFIVELEDKISSGDIFTLSDQQRLYSLCNDVMSSFSTREIMPFWFGQRMTILGTHDIVIHRNNDTKEFDKVNWKREGF